MVKHVKTEAEARAMLIFLSSEMIRHNENIKAIFRDIQRLTKRFKFKEPCYIPRDIIEELFVKMRPVWFTTTKGK